MQVVVVVMRMMKRSMVVVMMTAFIVSCALGNGTGGTGGDKEEYDGSDVGSSDDKAALSIVSVVMTMVV